MFTDAATKIRRFVYAIAILLVVTSIISALGFSFGEMIPIIEVEDVYNFSRSLVSIATVLLITQCLIMPLVLFFRIFRLGDWAPYFIICVFGIGLYIFSWFCVPGFAEFVKMFTTL
jgi:hypothetical protein